jgi:serine/threonine protein kinase
LILGAFSEIFSAFEKDTRNPVAIKLQNSGIDSSLMKWESHVLSSLTAMDFVPKLIHYGQEEGRDFLVMELLTGDDMSVCRDRLRRHCLNHLIPCPVAGHLILHMLANLRAMHETGFVHRDIKPSNFVRRSHSGSDFCMIDFGLAKQVNIYTLIISEHCCCYRHCDS